MQSRFIVPDDMGYRQFNFVAGGVDENGVYWFFGEEGKSKLTDQLKDFGEMCLRAELKDKVREHCPLRMLFAELRTYAVHDLAYAEFDDDGNIIFEDWASIENTNKFAPWEMED